MTRPADHRGDSRPDVDRLQAYLDGTLAPAAREDLDGRLATDPALRRELEAFRGLDADIRRAFASPDAPAAAARLRAAIADAIDAGDDRSARPARDAPDAGSARPAPSADDAPARNGTGTRARTGAGGVIDLAAMARDGDRRVAPSPGSARDPLAPARDAIRWRRLAAAAAVPLAVAGAWAGAVLARSGDGYRAPPWRSLEQVYVETVESGFEPLWRCEDDAEFVETFRRQYGQPLRLATLPDGGAALGLAYCHSISGRTTCILARVDGEPIMVFVDRAAVDPESWAPPPDGGLHLHQRVMGRCVLYEMSPFPQPRLLDRFTIPEG